MNVNARHAGQRQQDGLRGQEAGHVGVGIGPAGRVEEVVEGDVQFVWGVGPIGQAAHADLATVGQGALDQLLQLGLAQDAARRLNGGRPTADHAAAAAELALRMQHAIKDFPGLEIRIGINSGAVVAGVIGKKRFIYDLWGDTVNIAARMEAQGISGEIQISEATRALLPPEFACEDRGQIEIKGKGPMRVFLLKGRAPQAA